MKRLSDIDIPAMTHLHQAAFPSEQAWSAEAFAALLAQDSCRAFGVGEAILESFILVQISLDIADILTLATHPTRQAGGLASQLLQATTEALSQAGVGVLTLDVAADNKRAIRFYQNRGFQTDGVRKKYYRRTSGDPVDAYLMSRRLGGH